MYAAKRIQYVKKLLPMVGIDPARLEMYNLSAAMGQKWAEICAEFTERIRKLGPSPIRFAVCGQNGKKRSEKE